MAKGKGTKQQAMIYKTLHRQLKFEQHESHKKLGMLPDWLSVPAPLVAPIMLLLLQESSIII